MAQHKCRLVPGRKIRIGWRDETEKPYGRARSRGGGLGCHTKAHISIAHFPAGRALDGIERSFSMVLWERADLYSLLH